MTNYGRFTVKCQLFLFVCLPHGGSDPHHNCVFKHVKSSMAWRIGGVGGCRNTPQSGYSNERGVWERTGIALSAVARNSGPFALILLRGPSRSPSMGGVRTLLGASRSMTLLGPSQPLGSQTLLHLSARLVQKYESESLSDIYCRKCRCSPPTTGILKLITPEHLSCFTFII